MGIVFKPHQKLVFIGDSITDCDRQGAAAPYGNGYVNQIRTLLEDSYPELSLEIVNRGVNGSTVRDLRRRWQLDVVNENPDWLFILIGVNDAWMFTDFGVKYGVSPEEFDSTYKGLLDNNRQMINTELVLIEPFFVVSHLDDPFRLLLDQYRMSVRNCANAFGGLLVKTQDAFDEGLKKHPRPYWSLDGVHPESAGHKLIADEILRVCGIEVGKY
jgi:lysophospholipase L1-like esterase